MITSIVVLVLLVRVANYFGIEWRVIRKINYMHYRYKKLRIRNKIIPPGTTSGLLPEKVRITS